MDWWNSHCGIGLFLSLVDKSLRRSVSLAAFVYTWREWSVNYCYNRVDVLLSHATGSSVRFRLILTVVGGRDIAAVGMESRVGNAQDVSQVWYCLQGSMAESINVVKVVE